MAIGLSVQASFTAWARRVFMLVSQTYFALYATSSFSMSVLSNSVDFVFIILGVAGFEPALDKF